MGELRLAGGCRGRGQGRGERGRGRQGRMLIKDVTIQFLQFPETLLAPESGKHQMLIHQQKVAANGADQKEKTQLCIFKPRS